MVLKNKFWVLFKIKDYSQWKHVKIVYGGGQKWNKLKIQKQSEDNIIENIRNLFKIKKENKSIKDKIIRDIKTLIEQQGEDCCKPVRVGNFWNNNCILNMKVVMIEIKTYQ